MKFNQKRKALSWKYLWPIALAMSLGACGDGSGPSPSSGSNSWRWRQDAKKRPCYRQAAGCSGKRSGIRLIIKRYRGNG